MSEDHGIYGLEVPPTPPAQDLESGAPSERTAGKHERDSSVPELSSLLQQHALHRPVSPPTPAASPSLESAPLRPLYNSHDLSYNTSNFVLSPKQSFKQQTTAAQVDAFVHNTKTSFARLSATHRRRFLESLLPVLSNEDRLHLSGILSPTLKRDFLSDLPEELGLHVLSFIENPKDLVHASSVSKSWKRLVLDDATWKQLFERHRFGGGTQPALADRSAKSSARHPGVLPLSSTATSDTRVTTAQQEPSSSTTQTPTTAIPSPPSRLPGQSTPAVDLRAGAAGEQHWSLQGLGIRRQSAAAFSPNQTFSFSSASSSIPANTSQLSTGDVNDLPSSSQTSNRQISLEMPSAPHIYDAHLPSTTSSETRVEEGESEGYPRRPSLPSQQPSTATDSSMGSSRISSNASVSAADPHDPHAVGAAAARMDMPALSRAAEEGSVSSSSSSRRPSMVSAPPPALPRSFSSQSNVPTRPRPSNRAFSQTTLNFPNVQDASSSPPQRLPVSLAPETSTNPFGQAQIFPSSRSTSAGYVPTAGPSSEGGSAHGKRHFSYQNEFKRAYLTESNWLRGPGRVLSSQAAGEEGIVTCLCFDSDWIAVGMAKKEIHVFDANTGQYVRTLGGHLLGVWAMTLVSRGGTKAGPPSRDADPASSRQQGEAFQATSTPSVSMFASSSIGSGRPTSTTPPTADGPSTQRADESRPHIHRRSSSYGSARDFAQASGFSFPGSSSQGTSSQHDPSLGSVCGTSLGWGQENSLIVSGSCDRSIRVWDVHSGECLHTLEGHRSTVRCVKVLNNRPIAVSGSRDATVRVWNIDEGTQVHVLRGHTSHVRCLEIFDNKAVSGSYDNTCRLWDVDTGQCLFVYTGHFASIYAVAFDGQRIATGSLDSTVRIWSARTGDCLALLQGHTTLVGQLQLRDSVLVTGGSDGRVIVFSLSTLECLHRLCAHDNSVTCLQFDDRFLVTGGNDGRVKLFDFKTGQFIRELAEPCEAVWRITFRDDKVVIMCRRQGRTTMSLVTFRPDEADL